MSKIDEQSRNQEILDYLRQHVSTYLSSDGQEGHIFDLTLLGGLPFTPTLLLRTVGRRSSEKRIAGLIYGYIDGEVIVVASRGGHDINPSWYLNLIAADDVAFQIGGQAFRASWRELDDAERNEIWAFMVGLYPPYEDYQAATARQIPLVALKPIEAIERFTADSAIS